jgi:hypothetical protein
MTCWRTRLRSAPSDALALANEPEQDVLGADVVVAELQGLAQRELEHLLCARRERDVAGGLLLPLADDVLNLLANRIERDVERLECLCGDALPLVDESEQDVLGADVIVVEHLGLFLGQNNDAASSVGKSLKHVCLLEHQGRDGARCTDANQRRPRILLCSP